MKLRIYSFLLLFLSFSLQAEVSSTKDQMKGALDSMAYSFEIYYAPTEWKQNYFGWNLYYELSKAKNKIDSNSDITLKEFQRIARDFVGSTRDYHVGIRFFGTEKATLPLKVKGSQGRFFISWIDRRELPEKDFKFKVGDEVLTFNSEPVGQVIERLRKEELHENSSKTDQMLAEIFLTRRDGRLGLVVPSGKAHLVIVPQANSVATPCELDWTYTAEQIKAPIYTTSRALTRSVITTKKSLPFTQKQMITPVSRVLSESKEDIGARRSFIPFLGKVIWESSPTNNFWAYIFLDANGQKMGYVRISSYSGDKAEVEDFAKIIHEMNKSTKALIIDQVNNPGGSVFYLYSLASMLSEKPLHVPPHKITLTQAEVMEAIDMLEILKDALESSDSALLDESLSGYPIDKTLLKQMIGSYEKVIEEWNLGNMMISNYYLYGIDTIKPHKINYKKPILMLINPLDFSGGDFLPAILKDNGRVTLMGERTAGAGGYILSQGIPNTFGISSYSFTGSIAERWQQQPIENLGVEADIDYEITPQDLTGNYAPYKAAILKALADIQKK